MNKGRRNELAKLKQKKRVELRFTKKEIASGSLKLHYYKSTSVPCSCIVCALYKYRRDDRHKEKEALRKEINGDK